MGKLDAPRPESKPVVCARIAWAATIVSAAIAGAFEVAKALLGK
jgi:hypothetical protein